MGTNSVPPTFQPDADVHLRRLLVTETETDWFTSLRENLTWLFNRKKEPPLVVTSKPVPVKDIWGEYRYGKISGPASVAFHLAVIGLLLLVGKVAVKKVSPGFYAKMFDPVEIAAYIPQDARDKSGGGGGGGDRSPLPASQGRLPRQALEQLAPPTAVIRNENPRLAVEPTVIVPPDVRIPQPNIDAYGDPFSKFTGPASNGPGSGSGIGSGHGGGVGSGDGAGVGPGSGGGFGGGYFRPGVGGVTAPQLVYKVEPEYTDEARKAKYQGTVTLWAVVDADGVVRQVRVQHSLGLGLDEQALKAVLQWKFIPGKKDGKPVPVAAQIEVTFRLL
jgi:TonB family protein